MMKTRLIEAKIGYVAWGYMPVLACRAEQMYDRIIRRGVIYMYHDGYWGGFPFDSLIWVVFPLIVLLMIWGRRSRWERQDDSKKDMTAQEVLADRFARGKIDEKEYEKRLEVLKKNSK